jgi:WW domain-binding protein 4
MPGVAGEWEMVAPSSEPAPQSSNDAGAKRSAEALEAAESRDFKLRKRTMAAGLGQIYDPGVIAIKVKKEPLELVSLASPTPSSATYWGGANA